MLCIRFDFSWCPPTDGVHNSWKVKIYHVSPNNWLWYICQYNTKCMYSQEKYFAVFRCNVPWPYIRHTYYSYTLTAITFYYKSLYIKVMLNYIPFTAIYYMNYVTCRIVSSWLTPECTRTSTCAHSKLNTYLEKIK